MTEITTWIDGLVHEETQVGDHGVDLTVGSIHAITGPGRVDFGGGELEPAEIEARETTRRNPDDEYGWWELAPGQYLVEYNERLDPPTDERVVLQTRRAVLEQGAFHPTLHVHSLGRVPLAVGDGGLNIKENARVSTAFQE